MKLYTEEQLKKYIFEEGFIEIVDFENNSIPSIELPSDSLCINCDESKSTHNLCMDCVIKIGRQNIQFPTNEEIGKKAFDDFCDGQFIDGAIWMRDKIQGGEQC